MHRNSRFVIAEAMIGVAVVLGLAGRSGAQTFGSGLSFAGGRWDEGCDRAVAHVETMERNRARRVAACWTVYGNQYRFVFDDGTGGALVPADAAAGCAAPAGTASMTVSADQDTYVHSDCPSCNHGAESSMLVGEAPSNYIFVKVPDFGVGGNITYADMEMSVVGCAGTPGPVSVELHRVLAAWAEMSLSWDTMPAYSSSAESSLPLAGCPPAGWAVWDITSLAQGWADGSVPNYGVMFKYDTVDPSAVGFDTREAGSSLAPYLYVEYTCNAPQAFNMLSPADGQHFAAGTTSATLHWEASTDAIGYDIYFGTSPNPPKAGTSASTSYTVNGLTDGTTYYWKVQAKNACGDTVWATTGTWSFTVDSNCQLPGSFALSSPTDGHHFASGTTSATLTWNASSGATGYDVYFGTSTNPPKVATTQGTSYTVSGLNDGTRYYWKVQATNSCGGTWSSSGTWQFVVDGCALPGSFALSGPPDGMHFAPGTTVVILAWDGSTGATSYDVYFGTSTNPPKVATTQGTSYELRAGLTDGTTYYWKVQATNSCGGTWSSSGTWHFLVDSCVLPADFTLSSPSDGQHFASGTTSAALTWNAASGATGYDVYFGTSTNPPKVGTTSGTSYQVTGLTDGTTYYWKVQATNSCGETWSSSGTWHFVVDSCPQPGSFDAASPSDGTVFPAGTTTVTLSWNASADASSYELYFGEAFDPDLLATTTGTSYEVPVSDGHTYHWYVVAREACGSGRRAPDAGNMTFSVEAVSDPVISDPGRYVYTVAASAHTPGLAGTSWVSDLVVYNGGTGTALVNLFYLQGNHDHRGATGIRITVPAGASAKLGDVVATTFGDDSSSGALYIGSNQPLLITSRTYNNASSGTYGQFIAGLPLENATGPNQTVRLIQLTRNADYRTNIGFANVSDRQITVNVELHGRDGAQLGTRSFTIEPYGFYQKTDIFGTDVTDGYAVVGTSTAGARFFTYASVIDNRTGDPVFVTPGAGQATAGESLYIPGSAHVDGAGGTHWRTDVEVHNPGSVSATYRIELLERDHENGSPRAKTFTLSPGGSVRYTDALDALFGFTGAAALRITSTEGTITVTSRTYNQASNGTYGQFIPAVRADHAVTPGEQVPLIQLADSASSTEGYRTNIGLVNTSGAPMEVTMDLYDGTGVKLGSKTATLRNAEYTQVDKIFRSVTTQTLENCYAILSTSTAGGSFLAYGSVVDNRSGDPVYVPVE